MTDSPEKILTDLFLRMFSSDELRRLLRYGFSDDLTHALPGPTAAPVAVADAAAQELLRRGDLDALWPKLIAERPRRQAEIESERARLAGHTRERPAAPAPTTTKHGPIRILFVLACPRSREQLATQEEIRQIQQELRAAAHRDRFTHEVALAATYGDLRKALREHKPHILHIACHGTPEAELIFNDERGGEMRVDAATFVDLLDVLKENLRLVVLNACHSTAITRDVAPLVNLVIGMRGAVSDNSAIAFSQVFYESIAAGDTVERSFRLGINELRLRKADSHMPELLPAAGEQRQYRFVQP